MYKESYRIIIPIVVTALVIFLIWKLSTVILLFFTALMLSAALNPLVEKLNKKLPLTLSAILVILCLFIPLIGLVISILPGLIKQTPDIIQGVNNAFQNAEYFPEFFQKIDLSAYAENAGQYVLQSTGRVTGFLVTFLTLLVLTFYILIDGKSLRKLFLNTVPKESESKIDSLMHEVGAISGHYIRSNLLISAICGVVIFIGLIALGVPYAAPLALFAALMDLLPLVGAVIAAVPAVILAFTISPTVGFATLAIFLVYQQIENYFVAPNIYNKTMDISPIISFVSVIVGATLLGIAGAFLALPIAASIPSIMKYLRQ